MSIQTQSLNWQGSFMLDYGQKVENELAALKTQIDAHDSLKYSYPSRWLAIKLLEQDEVIVQRVQAIEGTAELLQAAKAAAEGLEAHFDDDTDTIIADRRYGWINGLVKQVVHLPRQRALTLSDRIDQIVTSRLYGIPIFLFVMWAILKITADVSAPFLDWVDGVITGPITNWVVSIISLVGLSGTWFEGLVVDGILAGVGGVLVFVPVLMSLYFTLAVLEDSGYMARAAFVMDRLMNALGLHGKSFLPMLVGFGCTVPALITSIGARLTIASPAWMPAAMLLNSIRASAGSTMGQGGTCQVFLAM